MKTQIQLTLEDIEDWCSNSLYMFKHNPHFGILNMIVFFFIQAPIICGVWIIYKIQGEI